MIYLFIIAGAIVGALLFESEGIVLGLLGGYLAYRVQKSSDTIKELTTKVQLLENELKTSPAKPAESILAKEPVKETPPVSKPDTDALFDTPAETVDRSADESLFEPIIPETETSRQEEKAPAFAESTVREDRPPREPDVIDIWVGRAKDFLLHGNLFGKLGIAVLFLGLSFLVREVIRFGFFPIELRLASAFLAGAVMIFIGWRLMSTRAGYGLTLQGGGVAILYLTIFAAFRLYELLNAQTAFIVLVVITILGTAIAILQNAQTLAVISLLGGFMAPVLTSTDSGNHVALFTYYAILNAGVFFMAWRKPWRAVHLTGFFSTFAIGTAWGGLSYKPELFQSTEPFLILFFLMYLGIGLMYATRHGLHPKKIVDGTLVFGLPVIAFSLQAFLVNPYEYGLAWSALAMGACYSVAAWIINKCDKELLRTLTEAFAGISLALLSMTIPFALSATWTGTGWALEGAALIWLGTKQRRLLVRLGGFLLILLASAFFVQGLEETSYEAFQAYRLILNPAFMGFAALSLSSLFAAYQIDKHKDHVYRLERWAGVVLLAVGVMWWIAGGYEEVRRTLSNPHEALTQLVVSSLSMLALSFVSLRLSWTQGKGAAIFIVPLLYIYLFINTISLNHTFQAWGFVAWLIAFACTYAIFFFAEGNVKSRGLNVAHAASLWLVTLLLTMEGGWFIERFAGYDTIWPTIGALAVPLLVIYGISTTAGVNRWPMPTRRQTYLKTGLIPIIGSLWLATIAMSFDHAGSPAPLPFLPILNPLDIFLGFAAFAGYFWYQSVERHDDGFFKQPGKQLLKWGSIVTAFVWMNATIARTVHHWGNIPYNDALLESSAFQSAISICWTLVAITAMTYAAKRGSRTPWFVAAGLLAVVIIKLFAIDLSNLNTIHRVISFIGVGILLLIVGYMAPVPPKRDEPLTEAADA